MGFKDISDKAKEFGLKQDLKCPLCGDKLVFKNSRYGGFYGCASWNSTRCSGSVGCHPGTRIPLGVPADRETKELRNKAHDLFDQMWKSRQMSRKEAYQWLADAMGVDEAHIGWMNKEDLKKLLEILK